MYLNYKMLLTINITKKENKSPISFHFDIIVYHKFAIIYLKNL